MIDDVEPQFDALYDCYQKLPVADRELLDARYANGVTVPAIAARAGRSMHSVYRAAANSPVAVRLHAGYRAAIPARRFRREGWQAMTARLPIDDAFFALLFDFAEDRASPEQVDQLEALLAAEPAGYRQFAKFMLMLSGLHWIGRDQPSGECGTGIDKSAAERLPAGGALGPDQTLPIPERFGSPAPLVPPIAGGDQAAFPWSGGGVVWTYVCAALFLGVGVLASRLWGPAGDPAQRVQDAVLAPAQTAANSASVIVGKVAAMSNCQWLDPQSAAHEGEPVARGRSYVLTSGLLQITYNTGARAILQGPAVYTVDAPNGGSLSLGKLTVEAGKLERAAMTESEKARNRPARPPRAAAFCVRTHTAIVLDKGDQDAKFGVEVDRSVVTYMRVFHGTVIFTSPGFRPCSIPAGVCVWTGAGRSVTAFLFSSPARNR